MFEQEVATKDGTVKIVRSNDLDELNEQVQASQGDLLAPSPDIDGQETEEEQVIEEIAKRGPGRPKKTAPVE